MRATGSATLSPGSVHALNPIGALVSDVERVLPLAEFRDLSLRVTFEAGVGELEGGAPAAPVHLPELLTGRRLE